MVGLRLEKILVSIWNDDKIPEVFEEKGIPVTSTLYNSQGKSYVAWGKNGRKHYYDESGNERRFSDE
ncbi:hypothetical protein KAT80_01485 [Candidatus Pacearchaeota archaeon]|nr:hypothetical protein [Candidatus Pacearchaeota archaeon]